MPRPETNEPFLNSTDCPLKTHLETLGKSPEVADEARKNFLANELAKQGIVQKFIILVFVLFLLILSRI